MLRLSASVRLIALIATALVLLPSFPRVAGAAPSVDPRFATYYNSHEGLRVLGHPVSGLLEVSRYPAQYFEKGRIEDHRAEITNPSWQFMYGRLTAELVERAPELSVSGTTATYADIGDASDPALRTSPPPGFKGGTRSTHDGVFVPFDPYLRPAPGYTVAPYFWAYMNRADLFPGDWLHDIGLPITDPFNTRVTKQDKERIVFVQAFERAVLTYDIQNPAGWQVEKGNIGADAFASLGPEIMPTPRPMPQAQLFLPAPGDRVILPLHLYALLGKPGEKVSATLRWQDGTSLTDTFTLLNSDSGLGVLVANLDWKNMLAPPEPGTQAATLEIRTSGGAAVLTRQVSVVSPNDPNTQEVKLFWTVSGTEIVQPQTRRILKTANPEASALEELLWGPPAISQVGFGTALPTPREVATYLGRTPDWGSRVTLLSIKVENGTATADFSKEMAAYGGGSLRVKLISDQIARTLTQFPGISRVVISVEGRTEGVLEP